MKKGLIFGLVAALISGAYFAGAKIFSNKNKPPQVISSQQLSPAKPENAPNSEADVFGRLVSINEREIVLAKRQEENSFRNQETEQEREERRSQFQDMSEEQRQAIRTQRQQEMDQQTTEQIIIAIPESTVIMKMENGTSTKISFSELEVGKNISIWKNDSGEVFYVSQSSFISR